MDVFGIIRADDLFESVRNPPTHHISNSISLFGVYIHSQLLRPVLEQVGIFKENQNCCRYLGIGYRTQR